MHSMEQEPSLFTSDSNDKCEFNIAQNNYNTNTTQNITQPPVSTNTHIIHKHKYHNTFGEANIHYHIFDNKDSFTYKDKYTTLLEQELQNPYWCLHNPITMQTYQISDNMDIETMPHATYFTGNTDNNLQK